MDLKHFLTVSAIAVADVVIMAAFAGILVGALT